VSADLARQGLPREKVIATIVRLLQTTLIRVGNREYVRANKHYGLTTLRDGHVDIAGPRLRFHFRGKSGIEHEVQLTDPRLARIVRQCRDVPGDELFQYVDELGHRQPISSHDVNEYIRLATANPDGEAFSAKDFRTLAGTVLAAGALAGLDPAATATARKRNVVAAVAEVAGRLGNTIAVCRKCYIHPAILEGYLAGEVFASRRARGRARVDEAAVLAFLRRRSSVGRRRPTRASVAEHHARAA
jgi:DNA topoisomerase-1